MDLEVHVDVKRDENGDWVPVLVAQWKARDDGLYFCLCFFTITFAEGLERFGGL